MPVFSVDTQAVSDTATRTATRISTIQAEVDAMNSDIATLETTWSGTASMSMSSAAASWHLTQLRVQDSLDMLRAALGISADSYSSAESGNQALFVPE
ncbi:WXG100 family type VII secretion target [Actinomyces timonensis]|uniref:WXG100 family type VII secretion target n=1 Tax=Actinomyces timonensis TaxID=1288391 RepID=UPI0002FE359E|nr:WXG100 family type VII secretion target [Actinomyces timonensis]